MNRRQAILATGGLVALLVGFRPSSARAGNRLRPPGARPGAAFERACIRCFRCAEVCPPKAIVFDSLLDLRGSDTPFLEVRSRACILCMKCTEVCPTDALEPISADRDVVHLRVKMGHVVLERDRCLSWNGRGVCRLCYYACPYADEAIVLDGPRLGPVTVDAQCVGCGLCEEACPEEARAIRIVPPESSAT